MPLPPYTTNDQVRATVGVTVDELSDETLDLEIYGKVLTLELDNIGDPANDGALAAAFQTIADIAEASRTSAQRRLYDAVVLFSPFPVALHLETAMPLFAAKSITDGKAGVTRHSDSPFKEIFDAARTNYERFRQNLMKAWASYNSSSATEVKLPTLVRISTPATDPVTDS